MDYEQRALQFLDGSRATGDIDAINANLASAQVYATLHLAAQQKRIADVNESINKQNIEREGLEDTKLEIEGLLVSLKHAFKTMVKSETP